MKTKDVLLMIIIGYIAFKTIQKQQQSTTDINSIIYAWTVPGTADGGGGGGAR
jgi:predicted permease